MSPTVSVSDLILMWTRRAEGPEAGMYPPALRSPRERSIMRVWTRPREIAGPWLAVGDVVAVWPDQRDANGEPILVGSAGIDFARSGIRWWQVIDIVQGDEAHVTIRPPQGIDGEPLTYKLDAVRSVVARMPADFDPWDVDRQTDFIHVPQPRGKLAPVRVLATALTDAGDYAGEVTPSMPETA